MSLAPAAVNTVIEGMKIIFGNGKVFIELSYHPKTVHGLYDLRYITRYKMMKIEELFFDDEIYDGLCQISLNVSRLGGDMEYTARFNAKGQDFLFHKSKSNFTSGVFIAEWPYQCLFRDEETLILYKSTINWVQEKASAIVQQYNSHSIGRDQSKDIASKDIVWWIVCFLVWCFLVWFTYPIFS